MGDKQNDKSWGISLSPQQASLIYSIIAGTLAACLIAVTVVFIESQGRAHINRLSQNTAKGIALILEDDLQSRIETPIFDDTSATKQLDGAIAISHLPMFDVYIRAVLPSYLLMEHHLALNIDGQRVYSGQTIPTSDARSWRSQASFTLQGQTWEINILPTDDFLSRSHYKMINTLILIGALLSVFISFATYTALTTRNKAKIKIDDRNKIEHLLNNLPGMAYQAFDKTDWPMVLVSEGCEVLTGYSKNDFETHRVLWGKLVHPDDYKRVSEIVRQAVIENNCYELEYRIISKNNGVRLVWERGEAVTSMLNENTILEGFITDVTHIKNAEKELVRSHAFSDAIVNSVLEAVITIDHKGHIKSFNNAAQRMFGYTFDEVTNKNVKLLMPGVYASKHDQYLADYLRTSQTNIIGAGRDLEAKRKDGTIFPIHLSINDIQSHEDRMFVGLIRDITQQRVAEDQKRLHIEQMAHADRLNSLGEMAAGIAHEVNQPLTAISLFSQSGKSLFNRGKFEKLPEIFEKLSQHSQRAGAVLERMQVMTKQGGRQKEILDCNTLVDEVAKLAEHDARTRDISIRISPCTEKITVFVDRVQIQQVLLNLLRNGMEAMQSIDLENGNIIELCTELIPNEGLKISVVDNGCGLASSMEGMLFTAFSSTKKDGMGIGLSISKSIIEEHGGTIHYAKNTPAGSVFYFILPVVEQELPN